MNFVWNTLPPLLWIPLALIPPAIVLLYFLKLRRRPLVVPSTYLWSRTIEDLHVNSIWQRLRQNLLLFLQLLLLALLMLTLIQPHWEGDSLTGDRFIFFIDTSASMQAADVPGETRLQAAKRRATELINQMKPGDAAMIISVSNTAIVEQGYTSNRNVLLRELAKIRPTNRTSNMIEALRYASGIANPGRSSADETDTQVAEAVPATIYILSDGGYREIPEFSIGNLEPIYIPIGTEDVRNLGIVAFSTDRNPERPQDLQVFGRIENCAAEPATAEVSLYLNETLLDAQQITVDPRGSEGVQFELTEPLPGILHLKVDYDDALPLDNDAYVAINSPRRSKVLLVSPGSEALQLALTTEAVQKIADVAFATPSVLETKPYQAQAENGSFDLVIFDSCAPAEMPRANTAFIGSPPPLESWKIASPTSDSFEVADTNRTHPLTQMVEMSGVMAAQLQLVSPPPGGVELMQHVDGPVVSLARRGGFEDLVVGIPLSIEGDDGREPNTNWVTRTSFPVFLYNVVRYLGGGRGSLLTEKAQPGLPVALRSQHAVSELTVKSPGNTRTRVVREGQNEFTFSRTDELGVYDVFEVSTDQPDQQFAINLFDSRESDLVPEPSIEISYKEIQGTVGMEKTRQDLWKWLLGLGLIVLVFEWYVYNRRVYL